MDQELYFRIQMQKASRWLVTQQYCEQAKATVGEVQEAILADGGEMLEPAAIIAACRALHVPIDERGGRVLLGVVR